MAEEHEDRAAQEARAARLRSKIGRITSGTDDEAEEAGGPAANETGANETSARAGQSAAGIDEETWKGVGESPRDFINRKMREEEEEGGKKG